MKLDGRRKSTNVEDRRGQRSTGRMVGGGIGIGAIIFLLFQLFTGGDISEPLGQIMEGTQQAPQQQQLPPGQAQHSAEDQAWFTFAQRVVASTEDVWTKQFPEQLGKRYSAPNVVIFSDQTRSACGMASAGTGPFYCPGDEKVYIDLDDEDISEALNAAHAIGDDNIQKQMQGYVRPESFTHGTSAQRQRWFTLGLKTGDLSQGDTFNARTL